MRFISIAVALLGLSPVCDHVPQRDGSTALLMDFTRAGGFFTAPFPNEDLRTADGRIDLSGFPERGGAAIVDSALAQLEAEARGFSTTAGIFFAASAELDHSSLPQTATLTLGSGATVFLVDVDPISPARGKRTPVDVALLDDGGRFGAPNLLSLVPYQGVPLRESTLYAAVVTTGVRDRRGQPLAVAEQLRALQRGEQPRGLGAAALAQTRIALAALGGLEPAAIAVFRTDAPLAGMAAVRDAILAEHPRPNAPLTPTKSFDDFCVYETTIDLPQYQAGTPPFKTGGGKWAFDANGVPQRQRYERARMQVTLPRTPMPERGFPVVVLSRTGGGDWSLVDHGAATTDGPPQPGSGPALEFARAGFAGIMVDGPLGGLRNPEHEDEQFLIFSPSNPAAIRDNIRQSAVELILTAGLLDSLTVDASACNGQPRARFDPATVALFAHSMGATIAPLALAFEPRFTAVILSGAGGSWMANLLHKQKPLPVRRIAELMFGYTPRLFSLTQGDPALSLVQWSIESADPPVYGARINAHVLMFQGVVDNYILPPMANAASLSLRLDLAGAELDREQLKQFTPYRAVAGFSGRGVVPYPVGGNRRRPDGRPITAAVVQRLGDGIQDGHEIVFQTAGPKYQYRCFLAGLARGRPEIVAPRDSLDVCQ